MNFYRFKRIAPTGEMTSGVIKLHYQDITSAMAHLERDGSIAVHVQRLGPFLTLLFKVATFRAKRRITRADLAELLSNLALMLRSGITLTSALEEVAASAELSEAESDLDGIIENIKAGMTFSDAAEKYAYIFPPSVIHLIRMGEETGQLDKMLKDAANHLKRLQGIISDTKQALLYPGMVFLAMGAGIFFWFYYVVPRIVQLFNEMDVVLPALTKALIRVSNFIQSYGLLVLMGLAAVVGLFHALRRLNQNARRGIDCFLLKLPVAGTILNASILAFITEYFALLLNAGIDILQSITLLKRSLGNEVYKEKMGFIHDALTRGETISGAFREALIFPSFVLRMINIGEMSGTMTEQLNYIAEEYRNRLAVLVATIGKLIEPVVLVVAGTILAVIIAALLLPIYDLLSKITA